MRGVMLSVDTCMVVEVVEMLDRDEEQHVPPPLATSSVGGDITFPSLCNMVYAHLCLVNPGVMEQSSQR